MRQMPHPIPVLTGSEYRDRKTMTKDARQNTTGKTIGTCGKVRTIYDDTKLLRKAYKFTYLNQHIYISTELIKMQEKATIYHIFILLVL